jgi:hypothetical protein
VRGEVAGVEDTFEVAVDETGAVDRLAPAPSSPALDCGEGAVPADDHDAGTPGDRRQVGAERSWPAPGDEAADGHEGDEGKVHHDHHVGEHPVQHGTTVRGRTRTSGAAAARN